MKIRYILFALSILLIFTAILTVLFESKKNIASIETANQILNSNMATITKVIISELETNADGNSEADINLELLSLLGDLYSKQAILFIHYNDTKYLLNGSELSSYARQLIETDMVTDAFPNKVTELYRELSSLHLNISAQNGRIDTDTLNKMLEIDNEIRYLLTNGY